MKTKELFKSASELFSKYRKELFVYFVLLSIILILSLMLSFLYGVWFVLLFFVLFPIQFGMNFVIKKMGENMSVSQNDVYIGFKKLRGSLAFGSKTNLKGFGFGLLTYFAVTLIFSIFIVILLPLLEPVAYNSILESANMNTIYEIILEIDWVKELLVANTIVSIVASTFIFCLVGLPANMAEFACFDAPLTPDGGVAASRRAVKKHSKQYFGINLLFDLMILASFGFGYMFYYLTNGTLFVNKYLVILIMSIIIGILWSIIYIYYLAVKFEFYSAYGKAEVKAMMDELKEATSQLNKLNEERLNKSKKEGK